MIFQYPYGLDITNHIYYIFLQLPVPHKRVPPSSWKRHQEPADEPVGFKDAWGDHWEWQKIKNWILKWKVVKIHNL